ncbi:MAG: hypothetical protein Q8R04_00145 [Nanoarchaeota archaeon]|nr:hypothetical protein [Nanoarchaeota archaeon]
MYHVPSGLHLCTLYHTPDVLPQVPENVGTSAHVAPEVYVFEFQTHTTDCDLSHVTEPSELITRMAYPEGHVPVTLL